METTYWCPLEGHNFGGQKSMKMSGIDHYYKKRLFHPLEQANIPGVSHFLIHLSVSRGLLDFVWCLTGRLNKGTLSKHGKLISQVKFSKIKYCLIIINYHNLKKKIISQWTTKIKPKPNLTLNMRKYHKFYMKTQ